jgi:hypothetical protein
LAVTVSIRIRDQDVGTPGFVIRSLVEEKEKSSISIGRTTPRQDEDERTIWDENQGVRGV